MRVLVFGGTRFVGRHVVDACLARQHTVTVFHRGLSSPVARADVEHVVGDRAVSLDALRGREWDAVFDTSGYEVPEVRAAATATARPDAHYAFVSSVSVYENPTGRVSESSPLKTLDDADRAKLSLDTYGALKVACERAVTAATAGRAQIVRAGLILGPHDYDARFAYWLRRVARGGEVLAPGRPDANVQFIDARDLAAWMVRSAEQRSAGVFNATGPAQPIAMRALLETIRDVTGGDARFSWVTSAFLSARGVAPYSEMPFWLPEPYADAVLDVSRAISTGLVHRPVADTVRDTWAWLRSGWEEDAPARAHLRLEIPAGISEERETDLLREARAEGALHEQP